MRKSSVIAVALVLFGILLPPGAEAQTSRKALGKDAVIKLLESSIPPARVEELAVQYGISFEVTGETESQLRNGGATEELVKALRELAPKPPAPAPPPAAPPVLMIEATPGGAQVFIDDEPVAKTSGEGRLKLSTLAPGEHRVRLSLDGYHDHERSLTLTAGETARLIVNLEAVKPEVRTPPEPARPRMKPAVPPAAAREGRIPARPR